MGSFSSHSGRVHSLPTVTQHARESAESYTSEAFEGEDTPAEINRPIWAVDLGNEMRALSTFELWMALSRGDLSTEVLVWRMGRECWLPAREIPELACALTERIDAEDREEAARSTLDYEDRSPHSGVFACAAPSENPSQPAPCEALVELDRFEQIPELDPADVVTDLPPPVAMREPRRVVGARRVRRNLAASVLGAAVLAASAIAIGQPASAPTDAAVRGPDVIAAVASPVPVSTIALLDSDESILEGADLAIAPVRMEDEAPRSIARIKRVSPEKTGQQRRRQK